MTADSKSVAAPVPGVPGDEVVKQVADLIMGRNDTGWTARVDAAVAAVSRLAAVLCVEPAACMARCRAKMDGIAQPGATGADLGALASAQSAIEALEQERDRLTADNERLEADRTKLGQIAALCGKETGHNDNTGSVAVERVKLVLDAMENTRARLAEVERKCDAARGKAPEEAARHVEACTAPSVKAESHINARTLVAFIVEELRALAEKGGAT